MLRPRHFIPLLLISGALLLASCSGKDEARQGNMVLHYDSPATYFEQSLPLGNGRLGACVYGGTQKDRISLNDITLWTGGPDKGDGHYDIAKGVGSEAVETIPLVRAALEAEDYPKANELNKKIQGHFSESYQPLGTLFISYGGEDGNFSDYCRTLDLTKAVATTSYKISDGSKRTTEYFVSAPDSCIVVHVKAEKPFSARISLEAGLPHTTEALPSGEITSKGYCAFHAYPGYYKQGPDQYLYDPAKGMRYCTRVKVIPASGTVGSDGEELTLSDCSEATILIVNSTSFNGPFKDPVTEGKPYEELSRANLDRVCAKDASTLLSSHLKDYCPLFDRIKLFLGETPDSVKALPTDVQLLRYTDLTESNPELEALYYQYGRYLLISSSRTEGVPANLQGLWNESMDPPWSSNYTININLEENYWGAEAGALPEMHLPLLTFIKDLSVNGKATAKKYYGIDKGWGAGHNSDIWAMATPVGLNTGDPGWANWNMGGAWLCMDIWERYMYSHDVDELKSFYPILKGAAEFCMEVLVRKKDPVTGKEELITSPSTSPENYYLNDDGYVGPTLYGATADLAIIRECLGDAIKAAQVLGVDEDFTAKAQAKVDSLRPYHVGKNGNLQEWYHDWRDQDPRHRHQSHLIGVYPGHQITSQDTPELAKAALRTLEIKGTETTGWSAGWRVNLFARLGDGEGAYRMLRRLLRYVSPDRYHGPDARRGGGTYPNLFDAHSPFQIDGNFGGSAGVQEMLLYSDGSGKIIPIPSIPEQWKKEGEVSGLRTRDGKSVLIKWKDGVVTTLRTLD